MFRPGAVVAGERMAAHKMHVVGQRLLKCIDDFHLGAAGILFFGGYMVVYFETWRAVFFAPAIFAFFFALFLFNRLRDRPEDVGLPPIEDYHLIEEHVYKEYMDNSRACQ